MSTRDEIIEVLKLPQYEQIALIGSGASDREWANAQAARIERWHERDVAHAVALERERIAAWLEGEVASLERSGSYEEEADWVRSLACDIRNGAHNAKEAPDA